MTKTEALYKFFSSFGIDAYAASSTPDDVQFPYLTYEATVGAWDSEPVSLTVQVWYYTESQIIPDTKAEEIAKAIGYGGKQIHCDKGTIWLQRGDPWCINQSDTADKNIKLRQLNITAVYQTF